MRKIIDELSLKYPLIDYNSLLRWIRPLVAIIKFAEVLDSNTMKDTSIHLQNAYFLQEAYLKEANAFSEVVALETLEMKLKLIQPNLKLLKVIENILDDNSMKFKIELLTMPSWAADNKSYISVLAELLYYSTNSEDISMQTKAIAILKGNYLAEYLKFFKLKTEYLNSGFYFNVIRLMCDYLYRESIYLAIIFDEYEHIFSWKDKNALKTFASDLKKFTDDIEIYKNLMLIFAESEASISKAEDLLDPAFLTRKPPITFTISNISSFSEAENLYKMIKTRYEKYYEISLEEFTSQILDELKNNFELKSKTDYRAYTTTIMKILDKYRNHPPKIIKTKKLSMVLLNKSGWQQLQWQRKQFYVMH